ncbi:MAG: TRAP transporter large permease subunit [Firmicutes bacterium]|nr:TRAP transporter large permease subunit [Bacillota bacterium]
MSISSQSSAAVMGPVVLQQMKKEGNLDTGLSIVEVAAGSTLTLLIPPGLGFILYAM